MQANNAWYKVVRDQILKADRIVVVSHIRPDGDAVGSLVGLGLAIKAVGKDVQMVLNDGVPGNLRFLEGSDLVQSQTNGPFDLTIVVDCSDLRRVGDALNGDLVPDINIDHHPTNLNFAIVNVVEIQAVATAEILALHLNDLGLPLTQPVANALLTGMITDTIGFRTANTSMRALRVAADLMEAGGELSESYYNALVQRSFTAARYWGMGLSKLQREGRMVWTDLSMADRERAAYPGRDDADLVNVLSTIEDVDVAIIFVEQSSKRVKISWRLTGQAQAGLDVSQIALRFGGGGHKAAAGAEVEGSLSEVQDHVLEATRALFEITAREVEDFN